MENLIEVGSIRKTHGYAGEVKLVVLEGYDADVKAAEFLFVGRSPKKALPFELKAIRGSDWIACLEGLSSKEDASTFRGQNIYLRADEVTHVILPKEVEVKSEFSKFVGFAVIDEQLGEIAMVEHIVEYPQQELAKVTYQDREVLIPLNPQLITGVDFMKKIVFMNLPEGLLEL